MPAKSKQQQKFFGVVKSMQKGDIPKKGEAGKVADDMKKMDVTKMASTKHKGLPKKVKQETLSMTRLKEIIKEEFLKVLKETKITPAKVQKLQKELVTTIDTLKKNFPMYKAAKEAGDEKNLNKYRKIALDLTKKKKDLELQMDKALGGLYQDAELELKEDQLDEAPAIQKSKVDYSTMDLKSNINLKWRSYDDMISDLEQWIEVSKDGMGDAQIRVMAKELKELSMKYIGYKSADFDKPDFSDW